MHTLCMCTSHINRSPLTLWWVWASLNILVMMFGSSNWGSNLPFNYCGTKEEGATSSNLCACLLGSFVDFHTVGVWESRSFGLWLHLGLGSAGFFLSRDTLLTLEGEGCSLPTVPFLILKVFWAQELSTAQTILAATFACNTYFLLKCNCWGYLLSQNPKPM